MSTLRTTGLKIVNYKAFDAKGAQVEEIAPINVIIGRNNSGKSAILDVIGYLTDPSDLVADGHKGNEPQVGLTIRLPEQVVDRTFPGNTSGGSIPGNHRQFGERYIGKPISVVVKPDGKLGYAAIDDPPPNEFRDKLAGNLTSPFKRKHFFRLLADRDIRRESEQDPSLAPDGSGATNLLQHYLNDASADQTLVEHDLLAGLNQVFSPDTTFSRVQTKRVDGRNTWEIYLEEEGKGTIALSSSGSGLKTVILVLCNLILMPKLKNVPLEDCIYGFEELENNLHPGLQRRLLRYIEEAAVEHGATLFLTTHSNVAIDRFSASSEAQIIHVSHDGGASVAQVVSDSMGQRGLLDDLDVRASDLLQANAVIWVEGPSDRVYVNALLEQMYGGKLREGTHYQCVFYGGRLLARLGAGSTGLDEFVDMLRVNRHCVVVMDRDTYRINETKKRIRDEVEGGGGVTWITKRKEIECDMPLDAIAELHSVETREPDTTEPYDGFLDSIADGEGRPYLRDKVGYAQALTAHLNTKLIKEEDHLVAAIREIGRALARWNQLELKEID